MKQDTAEYSDTPSIERGVQIEDFRPDEREEDLYQPFSPEIEEAVRKIAQSDSNPPVSTGKAPVIGVDTDGKIQLSLNITKTLPGLPPMMPDEDEPTLEGEGDDTNEDCPPLNIVIFIVGSRGK